MFFRAGRAPLRNIYIFFSVISAIRCTLTLSTPHGTGKETHDMNLRHEWKHEISPADLTVLRQRLRAAARPDGHGRDGVYQIRSLYFDTPEDRVLREKLDGLDRREKFRIRCYDGNYSCIRLEKKSKINGLCGKESAPLTAGEVRGLLAGERAWMTGSGRNLVWELCSKMTAQRLGPKTIVDYTREAFVFAPGNVRVTLDYGIRTGLGCTDFLDPCCVTVPIRDAPIILEVKWDAFLPDVIREAVQLGNRRAAAFSKYAACRRYG